MVSGVATDKPRVVAYVSKQTHEKLMAKAEESDEPVGRVANRLLAEVLNPDSALVQFSPETMQKLKAIASQKGYRTVEDLIQIYCVKCMEEEE